ncbi:Flowering time control protein FPA [Sesamum alatum]|uniref:Flowering time control protein FPA n=1 Tax=Sesamum alatum TaxID=300844 RepID=A0AAE1YB09_9LAMI|nr:Flowering time control protein FPA [Sesamum alatum]
MPFSSSGLSLPRKCVSYAWDSNDSSELQRDSIRSRYEAPWHSKTMEYNHDQSDCMWRGIIAKSGSPICHARCVAIGERNDTHMPKVVNCSGRIELDLLSKQYASAIVLNVLLFLPDSEDEFSSYTEFVNYLIAKDRAGVAKLDDGTMLFLVPPSNFLTKFLNGSTLLRLHGVVLKFPQLASCSISMGTLSIQPQYGHAHKETCLPGYNVVSSEERSLPITYSTVFPKASRLISSSNIQQEACLVPLSNEVNVNDASGSLPSEVECKYPNQQFQTALNGEIYKTTETEAEKNERYRATLLFAANLLSRVRQQNNNPPGHGMGVNESASSSGNYTC